MASGSSTSGATPATIEFLVKNPSRPTQPDFRLAVPSSATVGDVKRRLQATYPGSPDPAAVTVRRAELCGPELSWGWMAAAEDIRCVAPAEESRWTH